MCAGHHFMQLNLDKPAGMRLSARITAMAPSPLVALGARVAALRAAGTDVLDLGIGEPDFDTPEPIKEAAIAALGRGATKYTAMPGSPELRQAVADKFLAENGLRYAPEQIIVCNGVKQILFNAFMATLDPGEEVIVPAPYWMSYPSIVSLAGGRAILVACDAADGFKLRPDALAKAITTQTRWLLLNSPNNPSGAVYSVKELQSLADVLLRHDHVAVMSDDVYEHIRVDQSPLPTIAQVEPRLFERTLVANGVSKAYAMTGWRIGYAGGPRALIRGMIEVQAQSTSAPSSISQAAAVAALRGVNDEVRRRSRIFVERRDRMLEWLGQTPLLEIVPPDGAFYAFIGCRPLIGRKTPNGLTLSNDVEIASWLLEHHHVAVLPGSSFGSSPYVRLSFATSMEKLKEACGRLVKACAETQ
jgi:aspartate aminotransferase